MPPSRLRNVESGVAATVARLAATEGRGAWSEDLLLDERFNTVDEGADVTGEGFRSACAVPLGIKSGAIFGTLSVLFEVPRHFSASELELLEAYARQAAGAMDIASGVERLLEKARHDEGLQDFARRLLGATTQAEVVGEAARMVRRLLRADFAAVYLREGVSESFRLAAGSGWAPGSVDAVVESPGSDSLVGEAILRKAAVQVEDLVADSAFAPAPYLEANAVRAAFVAPLASSERAWGGIGVFWRTARRFRDEEVRVLSVVAEHMTFALPRLRPMSARPSRTARGED
jgi:GAF domain-containing protein